MRIQDSVLEDRTPGARRGAVWAVVLAAGEGRRFGRNKLLAPLGGRPLLAHALGAVDLAILQGTLAGGVAVVAAKAASAPYDAIEPAAAADPAPAAYGWGEGVAAAAADGQLRKLVEAAGLQVVDNANPQSGMGRSLALGLEELRRPERLPAPVAAVVILGDQPLVRARVIALLVESWRGGSSRIVRPRYAGSPKEPGHPVLLDRATWHLATPQGEAGLGPLLSDHPEWVATVLVSGRNPDVDRPSDLKDLEGGF